jgi:MFS superfamily sulfate permease-like transporter
MTDLLTGVAVGLGCALAKLVYTFSRLKVRLEEDPGRNRTLLHLKGAATFLRLPRLAAALERVPPNTELHVHFEELSYIDHACLDLLLSWEKQHQATGGSLEIDWEGLHARFHHYGKTVVTKNRQSSTLNAEPTGNGLPPTPNSTETPTPP